MTMRTNLSVFLVFCLVAAALPCFAQTLTLDLTSLDNRNANLTGPGSVDTTFSSASSLEVESASSGTYTLTINPLTTVSAYVQFDLSGEGEVTEVVWKDADESQTSGYTSLAENWFYVEGSSLKLNGTAVTIDIANPDLPGIDFQQVWKLYNNQTDDEQVYDLFPGDYLLYTGTDQALLGNAALKFQLEESSGDLISAVQWRPWAEPDGSTPSWSTLSTAYVTVSGTLLALEAQSFHFDYGIDIKSVYIHQLQASITTGATYALFPGNYDLQFGQGNAAAAHISLVMDATEGNFRDAVWWIDADSSITDTLIGIDSLYADANNTADTLHLRGDSVRIHTSDADQSLIPRNISVSTLPAGWNDLALFPGNYVFDVANQSTELTFTMDPEDGLSRKVHYKVPATLGIPEDELHGRFYTRNGDSLRMHGMPVVIDLNAIADYDFQLDELGSAGAVPAETDTEVRVFPGEFDWQAYEKGTTNLTSEYRVTVGNQAGGVEPVLEWKDHSENNYTEGAFEQFPPEDAWVRKGGVTWFTLYNFNKVKHDTVYTVPERNLSGAWYALDDNDVLWFTWDGEYANLTDPEQLQASVFDWQRSPVLHPGNLTINKEYGDNRLSVNCSSLSAGYYTLEITNEKNETFYLRFEKE